MSTYIAFYDPLSKKLYNRTDCGSNFCGSKYQGQILVIALFLLNFENLDLKKTKTIVCAKSNEGLWFSFPCYCCCESYYTFALEKLPYFHLILKLSCSPNGLLNSQFPSSKFHEFLINWNESCWNKIHIFWENPNIFEAFFQYSWEIVLNFCAPLGIYEV